MYQTGRNKILLKFWSCRNWSVSSRQITDCKYVEVPYSFLPWQEIMKAFFSIETVLKLIFPNINKKVKTL